MFAVQILMYKQNKPIMEKRVEKIKRLCKENNLSVSEVLRNANVSSVTVMNWEKQEPKSFQIFDAIISSINTLSGKANENPELTPEHSTVE